MTATELGREHGAALDAAEGWTNVEHCNVCGGPLEPMGALGNREHLRCRGCGMESSRELTDDDLDAISRDPTRWPEPEIDVPTDDEIGAWVTDSIVDATDGCRVEPDGVCEHGHVSWLLRLGLI